MATMLSRALRLSCSRRLGPVPRCLPSTKTPRSLRPLRPLSAAAPVNPATHSGVTVELARHIDTGSQDVPRSVFASLDAFAARHIGPRDDEIQKMLQIVGYDSLDSFVDAVLPQSIRIDALSNTDIPALSESQLLKRAAELAYRNSVFRNYIGMGYCNAVMPAVIQRNVLENPAWYTSYTPYQAEISQGRLESLINFQTMVSSLTGLDIANASLLDEATAAAEAMVLSYGQTKNKKKTYLVDRGVYPQTLSVLRTRAGPMGINIIVGDVMKMMASTDDADLKIKSDLCGVLAQYPERRGDVADWSEVAKQTHEAGALLTCATDLLALTMIRPPGEWGADVAIGNSARFGVPLGYGGPHAAFFAVKKSLTRKIPGRLIGLSRDADGRPAYRLTLQTREQHIRRDKALSNVCTAQALLANLAAFYAIYHGPHGLKRIAHKVHSLARLVKTALEKLSHEVVNETFFDRLTISLSGVASRVVSDEAALRGINLRVPDNTHVGITIDESHTIEDIKELLNLFVELANQQQTSGRRRGKAQLYSQESLLELASSMGLTSLAEVASTSSIAASSSAPTFTFPSSPAVPTNLHRTSIFLQNEVFNTHQSETAMMRYMYSLQAKDLSLVDSMIPLGSCTMKLNSAASMSSLTWNEMSKIHPFCPPSQANGYRQIIEELTSDLCKITGFPAVSLQPNSGAQGEYAGLSVIRAYHLAKGDKKRDVCLVPVSAHGTNPASAVLAGMRVVSIKATSTGELDLEDLAQQSKKYADVLAAVMITYPSTFGVFEPHVKEACEIVHKFGGQVYLDGANMNAQMGLTHPAKCGADVCHLNLHKTFGIPHGGGGPGVGPIAVASHLAPYLPGHPLIKTGGTEAIDAVSAAPWGSASILSISWAFIKMLGGSGVTLSAKLSLLNANYMAARLKDHYELKYTNSDGLCAHEFILDFAEFDRKAGIKVMDVAKRLIDYGFHPPTCSWPIPTAMLIEPTESENLYELDRFCEAMISIRQEIEEIIQGKQSRDSNVIKMSPHTIRNMSVTDEEWGARGRGYTREQAVFPVEGLKNKKFWPSVSRIDDAYGDTNIFCTCAVPDVMN